MADVVRTLAALQTLLADNTGGDIGAQDLRDMLVSVWPSWQAGTIGEYDDYFDADNEADWINIAPGTGTSTFTYQHLPRVGAGRGVQSVFFSQDATDVGGYVKLMTGVTTGDYIQAAIDMRWPETFIAGLAFTDGTVAASNFAGGGLYTATDVMNIIGFDGTFAAINGGSFTSVADGTATLHVRVTYSAVNTFIIAASLNGEDFTDIGTVSHAMTPTHAGLIVASQNVGGAAKGFMHVKYFHSNVSST